MSISNSKQPWTAVSVQPADAASLASLVLVGDGRHVDLLLVPHGPADFEPPPWRRRLSPIDANAPVPAALRMKEAAGHGAVEDAMVEGNGALTFVTAASGSARCQVFLKQPSDREPLLVNHLDPGGIYVRPRFVRPLSAIAGVSPGRPLLVALQIQHGETAPVLFETTSPAAYPAARALAAPDEDHPPQDVRLLALDHGYLLLTKTPLPLPPVSMDAPAPPPAERELTATVSLPLGVLRATPLDAAHRPTGPATKILGDTPIFQLDADVRGDKLVLLVTTPAGAILADGPLVHGAIPEASQTPIAWPRPLAAPTVLVAGQRVHLAVIDSPGTAHAQVLAGAY